MQVIIPVELTVEQYNEQAFHQRVRPPEQCGNCNRPGALCAHGSYDRYTTGVKGEAVEFKVARFLCKPCGKTMSCLPMFAQPYRLVASQTIEAFIENHRERRDVRRNEELLGRYAKRFERWRPFLSALTGNVFGRAPPNETATAFWRRAVAACGSMAELTRQLVEKFKTTCFGTYRCHQASFAQ